MAMKDDLLRLLKNSSSDTRRMSGRIEWAVFLLFFFSLFLF